MKVLVVGASGGVGQNLVLQAARKGHEVTAYVRCLSKAGAKQASVKVIEGDIFDGLSLGQALQGQDAVLSALGAPASSRQKVRSEGNRLLVRMMEALGIRRLISLSSFGVGDSRNLLPAFYKHFLVPFYLDEAFKDHELQEQVIAQTNLQWTIVRATALFDGSHSGQYRHGLTLSAGGIKNKISRADVADFIVKQLETDMYIGKAPFVSY
jgi:putative NADH-flavin reductase